jgi:ABC-type antimicrobial peptide transport system permease subunit
VAVGAKPWDILALVFRQGFLAVAIGLAIGLGIALIAMRSLLSFLPGLELGNPEHVWIAPGLVTLSAGIDCWVPARYATSIYTMSALRQE